MGLGFPAQVNRNRGAAADAGGGPPATGGEAEAESVLVPNLSGQREMVSSRLSEPFLPTGAARLAQVTTQKTSQIKGFIKCFKGNLNYL